MYEDGGGTLPRQQRGTTTDKSKILQRAVLNSMPCADHHYMNASAAEYVCHAAMAGSAGSGGPESLSAVSFLLKKK